MYCQLLAALLIAAPPRDTIPPVAAGFMTEHASLLRSFNTLVQKSVAPTATRNDRASLVLFLRAELLAQSRAEQQILYPVVDSVLGTKGYVSATLAVDDRAIERLVNDLGPLAAAPDPEAFYRSVWGLDAIMRSQFDKIEQVALPALRQKLSDREIQALLARMQEAERP